MKAAALLGRVASEKDVEKFRLDGQVDVATASELPAGVDAVLIFGGDGTVHRHLPRLRDLKIPMLVVPKGSGNDFAKALGIGGERAALQAWKEFCSTGENVRDVDLGIVDSGQEEIPFCCVAGVGLDSEANARANRMPAWLRGSAGYLLAGLRTLVSFEPAEFKVRAGATEIRRTGFFVAVGNAHRYGNGMRIAPQAVMNDRLLDACFVGKMSKLKLLLCLPTVFFGAHLGIRQVEYFQAPTIHIDAERPLEVYADGEYACHTPVEINLVPGALRVIVSA